MNVDTRAPLVTFARRARARLSFVRAVEWALRAAFWASVLALAAVAAAKLLAVRVPVVPAAAGLAAAVACVGLLAAVWPRVSLVEAAGAVDAAAGWKERLSSALALTAVSDSMEQALVDDVGARLRQHAPSDLFPIRLPRAVKLVPLVAVAILLTWRFAPPLDLLGVDAREQKRERDRRDIEAVVEKLEEKKRDLLKNPETLTDAAKALVDKIDALVRDLTLNPQADKRDVLAQISKVSDEIKSMKDELAKSQALADQVQKAMSRETPESGEFGKLLKEGKFKEAAQELAKMQKKLQEGKLSEAEKEKLRKQLEKLAERMEQAKEDGGAREPLAKALQGLEKGDAQGMDDLKQMLQGLDGEMAEAESLAQALKDLEKLSEAMAKDAKKCPGCGQEGGG